MAHSTPVLIQHAARAGAGLSDTATRQIVVTMKDGSQRIIAGNAENVKAQIAAIGFAASEI